MAIEIVPAEGSLINEYIDFPHTLYSDDDNYVPELFMAQKEMFNRKKNPFFEHSEVASFLAYRGDSVVGRISAIHNKNYNQYHDSNVGFFGFFDVQDDREAASSLLTTAVEWCKQRNLTAVLGPANFSTNDTAGLLIQGFEEPPKIMMTYNKPYYQNLVEDFGFKKEMDLYAYILYTAKGSEKSIRLSNTLEERLARRGIVFRNINLKKLYEEVEKIREIYNDAWAKNWGFVPMTDSELKHLADGLKLILDPKWCYIAEDQGQAVGFSITLPDINEITKSFQKGRLFPFNVLKLFLRRHKTKYVRIIALGVKEAYRRHGIEAIFFAKNLLQARASNVIAGEVSWVLESNPDMIRSAEKLNSELYKVYRIYRYDITS